jgi:initiation factor 1A
MSPNKKGGKGYKKGKGDTGGTQEWIDIQPDQFMARAIRLLGDRNVLCFCHDNIVRICHICRNMKGFSETKKIEAGDIVLVSIRDFRATDPKTVKRGDILAKYAPEQVRQVKNEGTYPKLFLKLEEKGLAVADVGVDKTNDARLDEAHDDGFMFDHSDEEEHGEADETTIVQKKDRVSHRTEREVREAADIEGDINIDDI